MIVCARNVSAAAASAQTLLHLFEIFATSCTFPCICCLVSSKHIIFFVFSAISFSKNYNFIECCCFSTFVFNIIFVSFVRLPLSVLDSLGLRGFGKCTKSRARFESAEDSLCRIVHFEQLRL